MQLNAQDSSIWVLAFRKRKKAFFSRHQFKVTRGAAMQVPFPNTLDQHSVTESALKATLSP